VTGPLWSVLIQSSKSVPCMSRSASNIEIQNCLGKTNQSWTLVPNGTIQNGGKYLDTADGGTAPGRALTAAALP
jgi:Ricin-type beta-trefoil lectin domain-like